MHASIIQAVTFLARLGRPDVHDCIDGLQQYRYAYEETRAKAANQIRLNYDETLVKGPNFNETSRSAVPRVHPPCTF